MIDVQRPQHSRPLWVALLVTPVATPILYLLGLMMLGAFRGDFSAELAFRGAGAMYFIGLLPALIAMFFLGLPLVLLLKSQRLLTVPYVLAGAIVIGILTLAALATIVARSSLSLEIFFWGAGLGALAGLVFSVIAGIRFRSPPP